MKVATWNVNSIRARVGRIVAFAEPWSGTSAGSWRRLRSTRA